MKQLIPVILLVIGVQFAQAQSKVAHANFQLLADTLPSRKAAIQDITRIQLEGQKELLESKKKFETEVANYQRAIAAGTLSPTMITYEESRLQKMQNDLVNREQELSDFVQRIGEEADTRSLKLIKQAVGIVAQKKGLNYVLEIGSLLYNNGTDITNEVIPELLRLDQQQKAVATGQ